MYRSVLYELLMFPFRREYQTIYIKDQDSINFQINKKHLVNARFILFAKRKIKEINNLFHIICVRIVPIIPLFQVFQYYNKKILKLTFEIDIMQNEQEVKKEQNSSAIENDDSQNSSATENDDSQNSSATENDAFQSNSITEDDTETTYFSEIDETITPFQKIYCQSQYVTNRIDYTWKLNHCSKFLKLCDTFLSMPFPETAEYKIRMEILNPSSELRESVVKFYIITKKPFKALCNVYIIHMYDEILVESISGVISNTTILHDTTVKILLKNLYKDTLTISFKFDICTCFEDEIIYSPKSLISAFPTKLKSQNSTLDDISDTITFVINGEYYNVSKKLLHHKCIEYFCTTYKENMTNDLIRINDDNMQDIFKILLSYIKTGLMLKQLDYHESKTLLEIANRCDLQDLKLMCEEYLVRKITIDTVIELMQFAFLNNAKYLKEHAASFIKFHTQEIISTKEFQSLSQKQLDKIIKSTEKIVTFNRLHVYDL